MAGIFSPELDLFLSSVESSVMPLTNWYILLVGVLPLIHKFAAI
jgi:hypothetical protein